MFLVKYRCFSLGNIYFRLRDCNFLREERKMHTTLTNLSSVGNFRTQAKKKVEHIQERGLRRAKVRASIERRLLNGPVRFLKILAFVRR